MKEELTDEKVAEIIQDRYNSESAPMTEEQKKRAARICARIDANIISNFRKEGLSEEQIKKKMGERSYSAALEYMQEEQAQED